jgi:hypothetical protein
MKNHFLLLLTLLITFTGVAQEFQGKAYYMSKTTIDPNFGKTNHGSDEIQYGEEL